MTPWPGSELGRERSWRFQRLHTQATTNIPELKPEMSLPFTGRQARQNSGLELWPFSTVIFLFLLARQAMGAALAGPSARRMPKWRGHGNGCA